MTREEAINYLKCSGMSEEQIQTVVEAFTCDDAISRADAEQMFRNARMHLKPEMYKSAEEYNTRDLMLLNAEQMIHVLPSVQPSKDDIHREREQAYMQGYEDATRLLNRLNTAITSLRSYLVER